MTASFRRLPAAVPIDSFSIVMATGIVSIAAAAAGYVTISYVLAVVATATFAVLLAVAVWRLVRSPQLCPGSLRDPTYVSGLYTFVAACDVLDALFYRDAFVLSVLLGVAALAGWLVLAPVAWRALRSWPLTALRQQARGSWLLAAVGTHSLAVTAAHFAAAATGPALASLLAAALAWWVVGVAVYLAVTALILWGAVADPPSPGDVPPDSWILMGGLAIAAFAGGELLLSMDTPGAFPWIVGVTTLATLAVWVAASAWIPALVVAEGWAIARGTGVPGYRRARWATVFPLGMYAAATYTLAAGLGGRPALQLVAHAAFGVALGAWSVTAFGLLRLGWRWLCAASAA